ncbi:hypothetical protein [Oceanicoccus sp. KOV_DT_Chl]|uniref:hypothetical protein n=1 Tax=Oceanicoccus sp. KOV_DT_Chl TaxID=1904639 RepID=UPI0011AF8667|nr:hypothetical protein [Oceanicoccus sp. KOV_DT_Chl]
MNTLGDITAIGALNIDGADGADQFTLAGTLGGSSIIIDGDGGDGGAGIDTLILDNAGHGLTSTGTNTVVVDLATDIVVNEIDIVDAGTGADTITGVAAGADNFVLLGNERVSYNAIDFRDIENVAAGSTSGSDTVTAASGGSTFVFSSNSAATVDGISFTQVEVFAGDTGADSFSFIADPTFASAMSINGGGGGDSVTGSTGLDALIANGANSFSITNANFDTFAVTFSGVGNYAGNGGADTVTAASGGSTFVIASNSSATVDGVLFSAITTFAGDTGADSFSFIADPTFASAMSINGGGGGDSVTGSSGLDTLVANGANSFSITNANFDTFAVTFSGVGSYAGNGGADTLTAASGVQPLLLPAVPRRL